MSKISKKRSKATKKVVGTRTLWFNQRSKGANLFSTKSPITNDLLTCYKRF